MSVEGLDLPALERWFAGVTEPAGPLHASLIAGGRSNLTYLLTDGEHRWVLRRPPLGPLTPTAHDMAREFRVVAALHGFIPVAEPVALCEDVSVIGTPFAVVGYVDGRTLQSGDDTAALEHGEARRCSESLVDTLAALHAVDVDDAGLTGFGRPEGYLERQVRRWRGQWDLVATREARAVDALYVALAGCVPEQSGSSVVHGDYRLDNCIVDRDDVASILAVVDWEMATLGDPLADLGLMLVYWDPACQPVLGVGHAIEANPGFLSPTQVVDRYAAASGRDVSGIEFYQALGYFKLAVIAEGIHQRFLAGKTVGAGFDTVGEAVPVLLDRGLSLLHARQI